jgi:hypothetical protein
MFQTNPMDNDFKPNSNPRRYLIKEALNKLPRAKQRWVRQAIMTECGIKKSALDNWINLTTANKPLSEGDLNIIARLIGEGITVDSLINPETLSTLNNH